MFKAASIVILSLTLTLLIPAHSFMVALNVQNKRLNMSRSGKSGGGWNRRAGKGNGLENAKGHFPSNFHSMHAIGDLDDINPPTLARKLIEIFGFA